MAWQSCLLMGFIVTMVILLLLTYQPWYNADEERRRSSRRHRRKRCRYHDDTEAYVSNHWSPRCSDAREPVMVLDDDDPDVPVAEPGRESLAVAVTAAPAVVSTGAASNKSAA